ncbi:hypothetical protein PZA11_006779 [Diplocarpon coronariae]
MGDLSPSPLSYLLSLTFTIFYNPSISLNALNFATVFNSFINPSATIRLVKI